MEQIHLEMAEVIRRHTVAIVAYYGGVPRQHATGTLVRFADHWFLVTASHAIKDYIQGKAHHRDLRLFLENGESNLVPLSGEYWATDTVLDQASSQLSLERD